MPDLREVLKHALSVNVMWLVAATLIAIPPAMQLLHLGRDNIMLDTSLLSYIYPRWLCDYQYIAAGDANVANSFVNSYIVDFLWAGSLCAFYLSAALLVRLSVASKAVFKKERVSKWIILGAVTFSTICLYVVSYVHYPLIGGNNCTIFNPLQPLNEGIVVRQSAKIGLCFFGIVVSFYYFLISISYNRRKTFE